MAQTTRTGENTGGDASQKAPAPAPSGQLNFQTDLFTGRFGYQVPLELAPGRHGSQPSLALYYNSASDNGWCGVGWDLDLGYIQRETKRGVPVAWTNGAPLTAYDDAKGFVFSLNGQAASLVRLTNNEYRAEIEGGFLRFQLLTNLNQWQVTDKSGNAYYFGSTNNSRMSNAKSGWSSNAWTGTYRWALARVESVLGDTADYAYTNVAGTLYPLNISYNGHTGGLANTNTVDFILGPRSDVKVSYLSGYRVELNRRLDAMVHKAAGQLVWSNRLSYAQSTNTTRTLLKSVTRFGTNLTASLPPVSFAYSVQNFGFQPLTYWTNLNLPSGGDPTLYYKVTASDGSAHQVADTLDMDGDGLPDRVLVPTLPPYTNFWVQHNNGGGFDNPVSFGPLSIQTYTDQINNLTTSNNLDWDALNGSFQRLLDLNGDSLPDRVMDPLESLSSGAGAPYSYPYTNLVVQLNNSTNWLSVSSTRWTNVVFTNLVPGSGTMTWRSVENGNDVLMLDLNGDGLPDRVLARQFAPFTNYLVQFNTGAGFTTTNIWGPLTYDNSAGSLGKTLNSAALRLLDLNGDGLPDRVMYVTNSGGGFATTNTSYVVEFNNGAGFEPPVYWGGLITSYYNGYYTHYPEQAAINDHDERVYRDINGDGLPDRLFRYWQIIGGSEGVTNWLVQINTGTNFAYPVIYGPYFSQTYGSTDIEGPGARLLDINGDGIPDHVMEDYQLGVYNRLAVELGKGPLPDLLSVVSNGIGGVINVAWKPSTQSDNRETNSVTSRQLLPFPLYTVASVSVSDGLNASNTTSYAYEGGYWNAARREFNGFARVSVTDPLGLTNVQWFHQSGGRNNAAFGEYEDSAASLAKRGMPFRSETWGSDGKLYALTLNKVEDADLGYGSHFAFVSQTLDLDYPGSTNNYRAAAQQFAYDLASGNLTNQVHFGEVSSVNAATETFTDVGSDAVYQFTTFAALANPDIRDKPSRTWLATDAAGTAILRESQFDYDGDTGSLTQQRDRICEGSFTTNSYGYNSYGNPMAATNEAGIVTTTVYDSGTQTFPVSQTAGGTFTSTMSYDPRSGQLLNATDAKGLATANAYDAFLRPAETDVSTTPNGPANQWIARYDYRLGLAGGVSTNSIRVRKVDDVDATNGHESWTYFDGLGRTIQAREEAETNGFRVVSTVYDPRGAVRFETLPYFSSGTNFTKPSGTLIGTLRRYDAAARLTNVTAAVNGTFSSGLLTSTNLTGGDATSSPVGSLVLAYQDGTDPWVRVRTDEEGKVKQFKLDAYGRTNQIVEVTSGGNYTTTFGFDLAGSLTNITDQANNKIEYAYNDLGQLVALADPDLGVWQYRRDYAGRLREQEDAKGQLVRFNYNDPLGRLSSREVYARGGAFQYGVTNTYDSNLGDGGYTVYAGQLFRTVDAEGWTKFSYDIRDRVLKSVRYLTKNGQSYTNLMSYDNADRATGLVYPNGGPTITNLFDAGGNLSQVKQVGGSNTVFWTARGFNALGQSLGANFGNGVSTTNDYYANSKRLKRVFTYKGATKQQDLTYTFDKVSNLKGITDAVYTNTAAASLSSLVYDDLHRLTSLTRPAVSQTINFSFDAIGNLTVNGEAGAGTYNYGTRLPHAVKSANGVNYAYDANGNLLVRGTQRLDYDAENRLQFVLTTTLTNTFGYAGDGTRLWKQNATNLQVWIGNNYEEKNGQVLFHILAGGQTVCTFDQTGTNVFEYYHADHLRSTSVLTDRNGNRIQHHEYSAFGRDRFTESTTAFPISKRYTSQVLDEDTGLYYYGARYYDPQLARFIQPDTVIPDLSNPQSFNRYSYALNNPLKYTDPSGHAPQLTSLIYDQRTGGVQGAYVNEKFGDSIRAAKSKPLDKPTLVMAREVLQAAADASYDPSMSAGETVRLYTMGVSLTILGVTDLVPDGKTLSKPVTQLATKEVEHIVEKQVAKGVAEEAGEGFLKRGPKVGLEGPHNIKIKEVADKLEADGNIIIGGGKREGLPEAVIKTPGGYKQTRRPDILYETPSGSRQGVNVGKTKADRTPVTREVKALDDLNNRGGLPTTFVPYDK